MSHKVHKHIVWSQDGSVNVTAGETHMSNWALNFWFLNFRLRFYTTSKISAVRNIEFWHPCFTFFPIPLLHQPVCQSVCLSSLMSRVITSTLNQTVTYWLQGGMSCHCSLAKCCAGSSLNVAQERLADCDGHQNLASSLQLLFLSRFAYSLIFLCLKGMEDETFFCTRFLKIATNDY